MNKLLLLPIVAVLLSGCSVFWKKEQPVEFEKRIQPIPVFHPPLPEAITWQQVEWKVLTPETMEEYLNDYRAGEAPARVYYGLTPEGYRALSENVADIQRYISQTNSLLEYYRENLIEIVVEQTQAKVEDEPVKNNE